MSKISKMFPLLWVGTSMHCSKPRSENPLTNSFSRKFLLFPVTQFIPFKLKSPITTNLRSIFFRESLLNVCIISLQLGVPKVPTRLQVVKIILDPSQRVSSTAKISAAHFKDITLDLIDSSLWTAISTPPPFLLNLLGLRGSMGCVFCDLSSLKTLYSQGRISLLNTVGFSQVSFKIIDNIVYLV